MSPIRRILVAIKDPWRRSLPEIRKAGQLARALGARVQLFHALSNPLYVDAVEAAGVSLVKPKRFASPVPRPTRPAAHDAPDRSARL